MPISFLCPHCQSRMTVPDNLAGKKGRCSKCKNPIVVPSQEVASATAPPAPPVRPSVAPAPPVRPSVSPAPAMPRGSVAAPPPPPPPPSLPSSVQAPAPPPDPAPLVDIEAAAAEAFADPKEEEVELSTVEFTCPQCDEPISLPIAEAGKRAPCPKCSRIIAVPVPQKHKQKHWRDTGPKLPAGAKRDLGPELEGAWGTDKTTGLSEEAAREAGLIKERERPLTFYQKYEMLFLIGVPLLVLSALGYVGWSWWAANREAAAYHAAMSFARSENGKKVGALALAGLNLQAARYHLRSTTHGAASHLRELLSSALTTLAKSRGPTRDALLGELAVIALSAAGEGVDLDRDTRLKRDEAQKLARQALMTIASSEARERAVRLCARQLLQDNQIDRAISLAAQVAGGNDTERAELVALTGLELLRASKTEAAIKAWKAAEAVYAPPSALEKGKDKNNPPPRPPLRANVVTLAVALERKPPEPGIDLAEREAALFGRVAGLAHQGKLDEARQAIREADSNSARLVASIRLVDAVAKPTSEDLSAALAALAALQEVDVRPPEWELLRLVEACTVEPDKADNVEKVLSQFTSPEMQQWAALTALRQKAARSLYALDLTQAEKIPAESPAGLLARLEVARQNTAADKGWASTISTWEEAPRAFGSLGVALGLQRSRER
ncbi:MAG: hypothetical protein SNJ82_03640 [Gemmataceae bacterium]